MKTKSFIVSMFMTLVAGVNGVAQDNLATEYNQSLAILSMDSDIKGITPQKAGDVLRLEAEKLGKFEIMDKYDVKYLVEQNKINVDNCFGKICLVSAGKALKVNRMLTGSIEEYIDGITVTLRLIDVDNEQIVKTVTKEYNKSYEHVQLMVELSLKELMGVEKNEAMANAIKKTVNMPVVENKVEIPMLRSDGPRMGFTFLTGQAAEIFKKPEDQGGYDAMPMMFQFGYQFEKRYLSAGNFQALFEFVPMITGLDQGLVIPSFTVLNGLRLNKPGIEFAFGPTFSLTKIAKGYYDEVGNWQLEGHWNETVADPYLTPNPHDIVRRMDSRGYTTLAPGFLFAAGYTIKSGNLNMPINLFVIPNKNGMRYGFSMGFNATKKAKVVPTY